MMSRSRKLKRKRGRPATGSEPVLTVRLPPAMIASLTEWAKRRQVSRSEAMCAVAGLSPSITRNRPRKPAHRMLLELCLTTLPTTVQQING